jgi:hypothetical protein
MASRVTAKTAQEYAQALIPHLEHETYRADRPFERLMGKGCKTCGVEAVISIADFQKNGDLEVFEKEMKPFQKKKGKK